MRFGYAIRKFALKAGEITGLNDDIFYLSIDEMLQVLSGNDASANLIPSRKKTFNNYRIFHPYPVYICGIFNPEEWYKNPNRRTDIYDADKIEDSGDKNLESLKKKSQIQGFSGSSGIIEGKVRLLNCIEEGDKFEEGEILVAKSTNIGWTLIFPKAAGTITDIGAPLSHASIVARELGIPAVVGTINATMILKTGDLVKVNGTKGIVEILSY